MEHPSLEVSSADRDHLTPVIYQLVRACTRERERLTDSNDIGHAIIDDGRRTVVWKRHDVACPELPGADCHREAGNGAPNGTGDGDCMATTDLSIDAEYGRRLQGHRVAAERHGQRYRILGRGRGLAVIAIVFVIVLTEKEVTQYPKLLVLLPAAAVCVMIVRWNRAARDCRRALDAARYYDSRLASLVGRWAGQGEAGTRYLRDDHPSALDLDLFGVGSLFELLCTARTRPGQDTLARWLLAPAGIEEICARHAAVEELCPRLDFHEDLVVLASRVPDDGRINYLARGAANIVPPPRGLRWLAVACPVLFFAAMLARWIVGLPIAFALACLVPHALVALYFRGYAKTVLEPVFRIRVSLRPLKQLVSRIAREKFTSPRLALASRFLYLPGKSVAASLEQLNWLLALEFPATVFGVRPQLALIIDAWQRKHGPALAEALNAVGDMEAVTALANRARENPGDPFPELVKDGPCFEAVKLRHPFLPLEKCVANDLVLGNNQQLLMISGSNMAGKSTFLRTVGINAVLALSGAPVRAARLRISPLIIGATLRVEDSLSAGRSRFFAEALRIRQLLDLAAGPIPLMFLLDELFQGTNSIDRRAGAEVILRRLVQSGAIGLVTTHDLALTEIADRLSPRAWNGHFANQTENGVIVFDYRLRKGVVTASNALALLRMLGIDVD
jgi:hypothetical protein